MKRITLYYMDGRKEEVTVPTAAHVLLTTKEMATVLFDANPRVDHLSIKDIK